MSEDDARELIFRYTDAYHFAIHASAGDVLRAMSELGQAYLALVDALVGTAKVP